VARGPVESELAIEQITGLGLRETGLLKILAISGSLRSASRNTALLGAARLISLSSVRISLYRGLAGLPGFNPDIEAGEPAPVHELKRNVAAADGLLLACPEYAHGVSGVLKNALDWLVSGEEFVHKPIALWNTSPRAAHAQASLAETVSTMSGRIVTQACLALPLLGTSLTSADIAADSVMRSKITGAIAAFESVILEWRRSST
jgi:NAD(P)H-dependent FMN reductase